MPWLPQAGLNTGPSGEEVGEGSTVAKRLPGVFGHNRSVWCQEGHPPAGTVCGPHRKGWVVAHVCNCHSVPYGLELSVVSQEVTGREHLPDRYKVCLGSVLETIEGRLVGSTLRHLTLRQCDRFEDTDKKTTQAP